MNIGDRQRGRICGENVIDIAECKKETITKAIRSAISTEFRTSLKGIKNPYGKGNASERIIKKLKTIPLNEKLIKKFFNYENI